MAHNGNGAPNKLALAAGFGIGFTWIVLAVLVLIAAMQGKSYDRPDYALAWGLVGVFLLGAGICAVIGTWWHNLRPHPEH